MSHAKPLNQDHIVPTQIERKPTRYCGANKTHKRGVAPELSWNHKTGDFSQFLIYVHLLQTPPTPWGCCHSITTIKDASPPDLYFVQIWAQCQRLKAIWKHFVTEPDFKWVISPKEVLVRWCVSDLQSMQSKSPLELLFVKFRRLIFDALARSVLEKLHPLEQRPALTCYI